MPNQSPSPAYSSSKYNASQYQGAANPPRIQGQQPIAGRTGGVGANTRVGQDYHRQQYAPQQNTHQQRQQAPIEDPDDDDKFERRGDYYQCVKCEEYTVHFKNDKYCENPACPSNRGSTHLNKPRK